MLSFLRDVYFGSLFMFYVYLFEFKTIFQCSGSDYVLFIKLFSKYNTKITK